MSLPERYVVLVTGSRYWTAEQPIRQRLVTYPPHSVLLHGAGTGADEIADRVGRGLPKIFDAVFGLPALWHATPSSAIDRSAGPRRSAVLVDLAAVFVRHGLLPACEAFDLGGTGTRRCVERFESKIGVRATVLQGVWGRDGQRP